MRRLSVLLLTVLLFGPVAVTAQETTQPEGTISVEDTAADDTRIANRIRDILGQLDGYGNVSVEVNAGIVTLTGRALDAEAVSRLDQLVTRVEGVVTIENRVERTTDLAERLDPALDRFTGRLSQAVAYVPLLLVALIVGAVVAVLGILLSRWDSLWQRLAPNPFIADILRQIVRLVFLLAAIVIALDILGATALLGTFLGAAGIIGLALGFAVKDTVENFIASVMLSLRQPFRPNDLVEIEGDEGHVIRLTSRATILLSRDGNHIRIPNSTVFKARIVNYTRNDDRRFEFVLGVDADADLARVREVGTTALQSLPFTLERPAPAVLVERVGDSNVELTFAGWINQSESDFRLARSEAIRIVKAAIEEAGFALPEPIYRVKLDQGKIPSAPADDTKPAKQRPESRKPKKSASADADSASASKDETLEAKVEAERQETQGSDLLSRAAPEE